MGRLQESRELYLLSQGQIRGPYDIVTLDAMRQRNRLAADAQVSHDRRTWLPLHELGGAFALAQESVDAAQPPPLAAGAATADYYYSMRGAKHGPVTLDALLALLDSGDLKMNDLGWLPGYPNWVAVADLPGVRPPLVRHSANLAWLWENPAPWISLALGVFVVVTIPTWYLLNRSSEYKQDLDIKEQAANERRLTEETSLLSRADWAVKIRHENQQQRDQLLQQGALKVRELESTRLQFSSMPAGVLDASLGNRVSQLQSDLSDLDDKLETLDATNELLQRFERQARELGIARKRHAASAGLDPDQHQRDAASIAALEHDLKQLETEINRPAAQRPRREPSVRSLIVGTRETQPPARPPGVRKKID